MSFVCYICQEKFELEQDSKINDYMCSCCNHIFCDDCFDLFQEDDIECPCQLIKNNILSIQDPEHYKWQCLDHTDMDKILLEAEKIIEEVNKSEKIKTIRAYEKSLLPKPKCFVGFEFDNELELDS